eukprot:1675684-Alexandrium_andersonii.AAC.1
MSPLRAQGLLLRAAARHALGHPQEDDPHRAAGQHPVDHEALPTEADRGAHHHRGLRTCRLPRAGCSSGMGFRGFRP